jgi:hypothetical protein
MNEPGATQLNLDTDNSAPRAAKVCKASLDSFQGINGQRRTVSRLAVVVVVVVVRPVAQPLDG